MQMPLDRRRKSRKIYEVKEMNDLHHEITRRLLCGQKSTTVAEQLGCTPQTVSNVRNSTIVKDKLEMMHGAKDANSVDLAAEIQEMAPKALENLRQVIESEDDEVPLNMKVKESNNILDRAGYGATQKVDSRHVHAHFSSEEIEELKGRAMAAGALVE